MTISANVGRQEVISASVDVELIGAALVTGVAQNAIQLPPNAYIIGGQVDTVVAFDSVTTDDVDVVIGTETLLTAGDVAVLGVSVPLTASQGIKTTAPTWVTIEWNGAGGSETEGTARLTVQYVVDGRACFSEG